MFFEDNEKRPRTADLKKIAQGAKPPESTRQTSGVAATWGLFPPFDLIDEIVSVFDGAAIEFPIGVFSFVASFGGV